jgi:hypothetical protein
VLDVTDQASVCALIAQFLAAVGADGAPQAFVRTWDPAQGLGSWSWLIAVSSVRAVCSECAWEESRDLSAVSKVGGRDSFQ